MDPPKRSATATTREIDRDFTGYAAALRPDAAGSNLPTFSRDPSMALASLTTCPTNLQAGCNVAEVARSREYYHEWQYFPGPRWCHPARSAPAPDLPVVPSGRLGVPRTTYL